MNNFAEGKKSSISEASPVWVPDSNALICMRCHKSEFTVINRRVGVNVIILDVDKAVLTIRNLFGIQLVEVRES